MSEDTAPRDSKEKGGQVTAIAAVFEAVKELDPNAAFQVLKIVASLLVPGEKFESEARKGDEFGQRQAKEQIESGKSDDDDEIESESDDYGISAPGAKWLKRNKLSAEGVSAFFSLGVDEIDVVANEIPGTSGAQKLKEIFLLKGVAALLATGSARFSHEEARELCEHYGAWDTTNQSKYIKAISHLVSGSRGTGYQLTAKGLSEAAKLISSMAT